MYENPTNGELLEISLAKIKPSIKIEPEMKIQIDFSNSYNF